MVIKYNIDINNQAILDNINRLTNHIFKLLPSREEGGDWITPLKNIILEVAGMSNLLEDHTILFRLLCKLEGLLTLTNEDDFLIFRATIFECLGLCNNIKKVIK